MEKFWDTQAKLFKDDVKAVNYDPLEEELEFFILEKLLENDESVCDLGCGNGRTLIHFAQENKNCYFYGVDSSENMIEVANEQKHKLNIPNLIFLHYDACSAELPKLLPKFDKVITKRLLINLKNKTKLLAIENIYSILKENGIYIMIECFIEPLELINKIRNELNLNEIKTNVFNEYLSEDIFQEISNKFSIQDQIDFESLYYFISRIFNAYLSEGEPSYYASINKLAIKLSKLGINPIKGYSPEKLFILKKN